MPPVSDSISEKLEQVQAGRESRGQRTRLGLQEAALRLLGHDKSFSSLSLREVTREAGIVPTAFYRHYQTMEDLGQDLVTDSFRTLRRMIRSVRSEGLPDGNVIGRTVETLVKHVHANRMHFQFIARERYGGYSSLRVSIQQEIRAFGADLATDLARFPVLDRWDADSMEMLTTLMVNAMVSIAEQILDAPQNDAAAEAEIVRRAERQLVFISLAVPAWRPIKAAK
ncbi:MAG: Transcriptional regulator, TetR family [Hydrocarboniphaga sp.]|uniref:TetR family transcriptional regulator n=1 Tax=Hydrocarboniphaga sp. TaxID=2033016 RepID=UPI00261C7AE2|nr:TetR family transcriptional regulator [Hydrocarboniphaga sp.]MDB5967615.1 Transcriptional regulator, TetR family [Hydrocarboniphaga sp.]